MHSQTQRILATLEVLQTPPINFSLPFHENVPLSPWFWEENVHGNFCPLMLAQQEGWLEITDPEIAFHQWQFSERHGLAASGIFESDPSCIEDDDANILLDEADRQRRTVSYEHLLDWVESHLSEVQSVLVKHNSDYTWSFIVGKLADGQWLAIAPTVPNETPCYVRSIAKSDQGSEHECNIVVSDIPAHLEPHSFSEPTFNRILSELPPIKIYGWYDGGYNITHDYHLVSAQGNSQQEAIEQLFLVAGFLKVYSFEQFHPGERTYGCDSETANATIERYRHFNDFLNTALPNAKLYCFCFWDYEHLYLIDQPPDVSNGDRVGVVLRSQFTYNP
jgi:hypothetical protein